MNIYLFVYFILMLNAFLSHGLSEKGKKYLYIINCLILLGLVILRNPADTTWPDTGNYLNHFLFFSKNDSLKTSFMTGWEPGIIVLAKIASFISTDKQFYIVVFGIIILVPIFYMIWKYSENAILGIAVFYAMGFLTSTSIYRQWIAIAILTYSIKYIENRQLWKFLRTIVIAFLFHRTAIIFVVAYFIYGRKIDGRIIVGSLGTGLMLGICGKYILRFLNLFARNEEVVSKNGGVKFLIVLWGVVIVAYVVCKEHLNDKRVKLPFMMMLIAATLQPLSFTFSTWVRVVYYFSIYISLGIPAIVKAVRYDNEKIVVLVEQILLALMLFWFLAGGLNEYFPYWKTFYLKVYG